MADGRPGAVVAGHGSRKLVVGIDKYLIYHPEERATLRFEYTPGYLRPPPEAT